MKLTLIVEGLPPCPRNRSHTIVTRGKFAQNIKTETARQYEQALDFHLRKFKVDAEKFRVKFDVNRDALHAEWTFTTPDLYTKTGKVNENSVDLDAHKVLQDTVCEFIGIDDAYIVQETKRKVYGATHAVNVTFTIVGITHENSDFRL